MRILHIITLILLSSNLFAICPNLVGRYSECKEIDDIGNSQKIDLNYLIQQKSILNSTILTMTYTSDKDEQETIKLYENMSTRLEAQVLGGTIGYEAKLECTNNSVVIRFKNGKFQGSQFDSTGDDHPFNLEDILLPLYQKAVFTYSLNEQKDLLIESEIDDPNASEPINNIVCKRI